MKIEVDLQILKKFNLSVDQFIVLKLLYYKQFEEIKNFYDVRQAISIRDSLFSSNFLLSDNSCRFTETILSKENVEKLLNLKVDKINFWEFYVCYPVKIGSRALRAAKEDSKIAEKHKKKYLQAVKTVEQHNLAIESVEAFVAKKKQTGELEYLPNMETVMNNNMWEQWEVFIGEIAKGGKEWNNESI